MLVIIIAVLVFINLPFFQESVDISVNESSNQSVYDDNFDNSQNIDTQESENNPRQDENIVSPNQVPETTNQQNTTPPSNSSNSNTSNIPSGVLTIINSLENDGIIDNPYVTVDTSQLPPGTTVKADKSSWKPSGNNSGTIDGTISSGFISFDGRVTLTKKSNGNWTVTDYELL